MGDLKKLNKEDDNRKDEKEKTYPSDATSILEAFEYIVEMASDSNLSEEFYKKADRFIKYCGGILNLSDIQVVLLSIFVDKSEDNRIYISEIAKYLDCRTTKILRIREDIDVLENLRYLRASRSGNSITYRVPSDVLESLRKNQPYVAKEEPVADLESFFSNFNKLMEEKDNDEVTHEMIWNKTKQYLEDIKDTTFARGLKSYCLSNEDTLLFIFMAHLYVENDDDRIGFHDIDDLYDNDEIPSYIKRELRRGSSDLIEQKLIEYVNEDGMARTDTFKLTQAAKDKLLEDLNISQVGKSQKGLINHETLTQKELIYNDTEKREIEELTSILSKDRFTQVQERLSKAGMRPGFCCLFYGSPGTGKTETVYQLARKTGRNIMKVDVDKIKSCWVGESEKNIKSLFDRYRAICKNSETAPILLFNEADAVLGVRMEGASRAVDKMENSIQNIILQEMETLEGIMIATTNLTSNLDKAFERRFLYKVRYEKPSVEARASIWQIMLPGLTNEIAKELSVRFEMSGGEIENIARKHTVAAILSGDESLELEKLVELCKTERINNKNTRVGF